MTSLLHHPTLHCTLRGHTAPSSSTTQFRNLKFASIPARYKESVPVDTLPAGSDGTYDATHFGPSCPQKRGAQAWDLTLTGENLSVQCEAGQGEGERMDEFECLHVNVTVPSDIVSSTPQKESGHGSEKVKGKGLPVFVWVHGGGLCMGSNSWPQYDLTRMVERSVAIGKPIVAVSINYRLGLFGFLASSAVGANGNMGYKDQVLAFRWIKRHIAGFGGDPENVTAAGESAGGISLSTLLCADIGEQGLFERVVIMSGEATLRKSRNSWWHGKMYEAQIGFLGLETGDKEGLRKTLLEMDAETLAQKLPLAQHTCAVVDGEWLKENITLKAMSDETNTLHKPSWCEEFVVGDTAHDGTILRGRILDTPNVIERFKAVCKQYLTKEDTQRILEAYKLHGTPSPEKEKHMICALASDLRFYNSSAVTHKGWKSMSPPRRGSRYHFHVPNPFEGVNKRLASHELDVVLTLGNLNVLLDERMTKIALGMTDHFIKFANGEGWVDDGKILVFGYDGISAVQEEEYDVKYRGGRGAVLQSFDADVLWNIVDKWAMVRNEDEEHQVTARI